MVNVDCFSTPFGVEFELLVDQERGIFDMVEVEVEVEVAAAGAVARCWFELASFQRPFVWPGHCS